VAELLELHNFTNIQSMCCF